MLPTLSPRILWWAGFLQSGPWLTGTCFERRISSLPQGARRASVHPSPAWVHISAGRLRAAQSQCLHHQNGPHLWLCSRCGAPEAWLKRWRFCRVLVGLGCGFWLRSLVCSQPCPHPSSPFTPFPTSLGGNHDKIYSLILVITDSVRATLQTDRRAHKRRTSECSSFHASS